MIVPIDVSDFHQIVFFTGAGMSAESGVPTYRGKGGIWHKYNWEEYACQTAFKQNPQGVLDFHELRRIEALKCAPHNGHRIMTDLQKYHNHIWIVTQNIDGMHQRAGSQNIIELHGSLWRMRCDQEGEIMEDLQQAEYRSRKCSCGAWLRPDIIWFQDMLNEQVVSAANEVISSCDLFVSIGTSGVVWPAAGYPKMAKENGAYCIEINPEATELTYYFDKTVRQSASTGLWELFNLEVQT